MLLQENIPLAPLTTFQLGGPARFFVEAKSAADVQEAVAFARSRICRFLFWAAAAIWWSPTPAGPDWC